jgi:type II secretory pathway pseudopilin PulG
MSRFTKVALVVGYLALGAAAAVAHFSPSAGYELSIYTATPVPFWAAVAVAFVVAVPVAYTSEGTPRSLALLLSVVAFLAITTLPLSRGYYFYGPADSMTHLGWAKDLVTGRMYVLDLFYPGLHTTTIFTSALSTESLRRGMLLVVALFPLAFVAFSYLSVRAVVTEYSYVVSAVFVSLLLLPLNHVTTHYMSPHPISDSILLIPFGIFILARYVTNVERQRTVTKIGVIFALYSVATLFYHSMQALHLLILLGGVLFVQLYFKAKVTLSDIAAESYNRITTHRPLYVQTGFLGGLFLLWNLNHEPVRNSIRVFLFSVNELLSGSGESAEVVRDRTGSLEGIGASAFELFTRLFLPSAVFCAIVGALMILVFLGRLDDEHSDADALVEYLCVALVGLIAFDLALLAAGNTSRLFFRTLGAVMAVVSILSVFAVPRLLEYAPRQPGKRFRQAGAVLAVLLLLVATVPIVYPSPYIFKENRMVTQQQFTGYETSFEHGAEDVEFATLRQGPWRSYHGLYGVETTEERTDTMRRNSVSFQNLTRLQSLFDSDHYVSIRRGDRVKEVGLYNEFRYTAAGFRSLDWQTDVHRVVSNGGYDSYLVDKGGASA